MGKRKSIVVTSSMIRVALEVLRSSGRLDFEADGADDLLVRRMLQAAFDDQEKRRKRRDVHLGFAKSVRSDSTD